MDLTPYELERQAKLAENARLLESLGLGTFDDQPQRKKQRVSKAKVDTPTRRLPSRRTRRERNLSDSPYTPEDEEGNEDDDDEDNLSFIDETLSEDDTRMRRAPYGPPKARNRGSRTKVVIKNGRVYDPVNGTSCHQCRQKTLDPKIACTNILTGWDGSAFNCTLMMCFRCLPNRYGQDVFSELKDEWQCPKCTGICNCSFCRKAKGKAPTGIMIMKARALGFACVADMLAEMEGRSKNTKRASTPKAEESGETEVEQLDIKDNLVADKLPAAITAIEIMLTESASEEIADAALAAETLMSTTKATDDDEDEVESIVDVKLHYGALRFRVRWRGHDESADTYEPLEHVADLAALDAYEVTRPRVAYKGRSLPLRTLLRHSERGALKTYLASFSSSSPSKKAVDKGRRQSARF